MTGGIRLATATLVAGAGGLVGLASSAAAAAPSPGSAWTSTYPDAQGEDPAAPDIASVSVANDGSALSFMILVANRTALLPTMRFQIALNTDSNGNTGSPDWDGAEYVIQVSTNGPMLFKWNGTDWDAGVAQTLVSAYLVGANAGGLLVSIDTRELGSPTSFMFFASARDGDAYDDAPATAAEDFSYVMSLAPPVATKGTAGVSHTIKKPKAKKARKKH
jgi:hypothetical protein